MKYLQSLIILLIINQSGNAQNISKFNFFAGYGYYQGYTSGIEHNIKNGNQNMDLALGYNRLKERNQKLYSVTLGYNLAIRKSHINVSGGYKWHINSNIVYWHLEDDFYRWKAISLIPSLNREFDIYRKLKMSVDLGPAFNIVLSNKRKTYREVGSPYHVMPNLRILFII